MKKKIALIAVTAILASSITAYASSVMFSDTQFSYASKEIQKLADLGIVKGFEDGTFRPQTNVTREQEAAIIGRLLEVLEKQREGDIALIAAQHTEDAAKLAELQTKLDEVKKIAETKPPTEVTIVRPNPPTPVVVDDATEFVVMEDFGFGAGIGGEGIDGYNVGFNIDTDKIAYSNIKSIKVSLTDADGKAIASRTATGLQVAQLKADDELYGGLDGQLSAAFINRLIPDSNAYWASTAYDLSVTPAGAEVTITTKTNNVYKVSRSL